MINISSITNVTDPNKLGAVRMNLKNLLYIISYAHDIFCSQLLISKFKSHKKYKNVSINRNYYNYQFDRHIANN
jgi:hypothetical protein